MTQLEVTTQTGLALCAPDMDHLVCCLDSNITLCGKDGTHLTLTDDDLEAVCEECTTRMDASGDRCIFFPTNCPELEEDS